MARRLQTLHLDCQVGSRNDLVGALFPVSQLRDGSSDKFTGPIFTLPDTSAPTERPSIRVGFLMAGEGWIGGTCGFDPATGLRRILSAEPAHQHLFAGRWLSRGPAGLIDCGTALICLSFVESTKKRRLRSVLLNSTSKPMDFDGTDTHPAPLLSVAQVPKTSHSDGAGCARGLGNSPNISLAVQRPPMLPNTVPNYRTSSPRHRGIASTADAVWNAALRPVT
jgi:hypothetical protein